MAIEQQMEMAFMEDRPTVDPVSGNEVPPGSLPEEVRDDIDARLSEGEYVVPADVVRYYGVKFFEDLRGQAKMGLAQMESDGRIGGEPVDVAMLDMEDDMDPDSIPTIEDDGTEDNSEGMYRGGMVGIGMGGYTAPPAQNQGMVDQVQTQAMQSPATMQDLSSQTINNNTTMANAMPENMMAENRDKADEVRRFYAGGDVDYQTQGAFNPYNYPIGFSLMGSTGAKEVKEYYNPATGTTTLIPHDVLTGQPLYPPPPGFIIGKPDATEPEDAVEEPEIPEAKDDGPTLDQEYYNKIMDYGKFDPEKSSEEQYREQVAKAQRAGLVGGAIGSAFLGPLAGQGVSKLFDNQGKKQLEQLKEAADARATSAKETEDLTALEQFSNLSKEISDILEEKKTGTLFGNTILGDLFGFDKDDEIGFGEKSKNKISSLIDSFKESMKKGNPYDSMYRDASGNVNVSSETVRQDLQNSTAAVAAARQSDDPRDWHKAIQAQSAASKAFTEAKQKETGWGTDSYKGPSSAPKPTVLNSNDEEDQD